MHCYLPIRVTVSPTLDLASVKVVNSKPCFGIVISLSSLLISVFLVNLIILSPLTGL